MSHLLVQLPLDQERNNEPVNSDQAVLVVLQVQQIYRAQNRKRRLNCHVHVLEHYEGQAQVDVLQVQNLRLRYFVAYLVGHCQRFLYYH